MKWTRYGPHALLFQFAEGIGDEAFARGRAIAIDLEQRPPEGLREFVPSFTTILLEFDPSAVPDPSTRAHELADRFARVASVPVPVKPPIRIPVFYNGPDLERVAEMNQLSIEEVCRLHSAPIYKVYLLGFSPGFPYLGDLDRRLHTPRLASPRPRVAPGSVAIGGAHTGIYTVESPGGWNIIGSTPLALFDPSRERSEGSGESVFLLKPGDRAQFVPIDLSGAPS